MTAMPQITRAKRFGAALLLFLAAAAFASTRPTAAQSSGSGPKEMQPGVSILTPTEGVNFNSYIGRLLSTVKRNWYAVMPESAMMGEKGIVVLTFHIQHDGKIPDADPTIERSSHSQKLDDAAMNAVQTSAPYQPLPEAFHGRNIQVRFIFFYNVPIPKDATHPPDPHSNPPSSTSTPPLALIIHAPPPVRIRDVN